MLNTAEVRVADLLAKLQRDGKDAVVDRVHPHFATSAQATLRWSTTKPPMAQIPPHLAAIVGPDPDWPWFMYDWNSLHLWLTAAYAGDQALLATLRSGEDIHTANARDLFGELHDWQGKDDPRRTVAKRFIYRVLKGGDFTKPPGTIPLGLVGGKPGNFIRAGKRWAYLHAPVLNWQATLKEAVRTRGEVRTESGKRRRFSDRSPHSQRAGVDYPCQATEVEILNETILKTCERFNNTVSFKYQRHDFICWGVHASVWNNATLTALADIAEREIAINGETIKLEATFHTRETLEGEKVAWVKK